MNLCSSRNDPRDQNLTSCKISSPIFKLVTTFHAHPNHKAKFEHKDNCLFPAHTHSYPFPSLHRDGAAVLESSRCSCWRHLVSAWRPPATRHSSPLISKMACSSVSPGQEKRPLPVFLQLHLLAKVSISKENQNKPTLVLLRRPSEISSPVVPLRTKQKESLPWLCPTPVPCKSHQ